MAVATRVTKKVSHVDRGNPPTRQMKRLGMLTGLVLALILPGIALATDWHLLKQGSTLGFEGVIDGSAFEGHFAQFSAAIVLDDKALGQASIKAGAQVSSVDSDNTERDEYIRSSDFLDAKAFPTAQFESHGVRRLEEGRYHSAATLTLRGVQCPVDFVFTFVRTDAGVARLQGRMSVQRLDFGIGSGEWADPGMIGETVAINVDLRLRKSP